MVKCSECLFSTVSTKVIDGLIDDFDACAYDNKIRSIRVERECEHFIPLPDKDPRVWFK